MVQIIPVAGSIASQLGAGFGRGLAEQLPTEIKQARLSKGIEQLREQGNMQPLQQIQHLLRSGASMQDIGALLPFIQQAQGREALKKRAAGQVGGVSTQVQPSGISGQMPTKETYKPEGKGGFASESQLSTFRSSLKQEPSSQQIAALASDLMDMGITDPQEAEAQARINLKQDIASQQKRLTDTETYLSKQLERNLQGGGLMNPDYKDIPGRIQTKLVNEGSYRAGALGITPEETAAQLGEIGTKLGEKATAAKTTGSFFAINKGAEKKISEWLSQKKEFEKYGLGQEFDEIVAASSGLTPMQVAHELDPLKNKTITDDLRKYGKGKFEKFAEKITPLAPEMKKMKEKDLDNLVMNIKPSDNIQSISYEFREKGLDVGQLMRKISQMQSDQKIALTPNQERQLTSTSDNSFLGDILFRAFR